MQKLKPKTVTIQFTEEEALAIGVLLGNISDDTIYEMRNKYPTMQKVRPETICKAAEDLHKFLYDEEEHQKQKPSSGQSEIREPMVPKFT